MLVRWREGYPKESLEEEQQCVVRRERSPASTLTIYGISQDNDAKALSPGAIQVSWKEPEHNTQDIIGYVLHIRRSSGVVVPPLSLGGDGPPRVPKLDGHPFSRGHIQL
ncbi:uncharacterized protein LOC115539117 isoform X4 [Gadus morhua]|uniref:uncharacterized protein LOC115539117 isoform X4 n=1 Tax=Gadus morhua TaxID=8049 RepID=UPI0011B6CE19|nr:uncharacterized protein LOC115539117 isoform X4 [Gadus morhua]